MLKNRVIIQLIITLLMVTSELFLEANVQTNSLISVLDYVSKDKSCMNEMLLLVDLDNTLIESDQHLGSIQWCDYLAAEYLKKGERPYVEVDRFVSDLWCEVQPLIKVRCVDPNTPEVFKKLHSLGIKVLGLTARRPEEIGFTEQQLASVNLNFYPLLGTKSGLDIPMVNQETARYENGILYCGPMHSKSAIMRVFLDAIGYSPKAIVFIDDKLNHVEDIGKFAQEKGAAYTGFRFSGADERVKAFNAEIANLQYDFLPALISDDEATKMLMNRNLILSTIDRLKLFDKFNGLYVNY